jgi:hypothetical protein
MKSLLLVIVGTVGLSAAEAPSGRIKGFRVFGQVAAAVPVVIQDSTSITIEFDLDERQPADFRMRVYHCDRNWRKTGTSFVNNESWNTIRGSLPYRSAPNGVQHYRFQYRVTLPGLHGLERFPFSGNHIVEVWDEEEVELLAQGRFFVVERSIQPVVRVANRQAPEDVHPLNNVHSVEVQFTVPEVILVRREGTFGRRNEGEPEEQQALVPSLVTSVDVYKNREVLRPYRIEAGVRAPNTFVEGYGTRRLRFRVESIRPGNEYRRLDLRNPAHYPSGVDVRNREGADVSRMFLLGNRDDNGFSTLVEGTVTSDYLRVHFEFLPQEYAGDSVFVVGDFNGWVPRSPMRYDPSVRRYLWSTWLRRGIHEYQYVLNGSDWTALEGNDWRTTNVYSGFIYYRDQRYGGFDRIIGFGQRTSSGSSGASSF